MPCWTARLSLPANQADELVNGDAGLSNERPERSLAHFAVVWNGEAAMRRFRMAKDDVAAPLPVDFVPQPPERSNDLSTGNPREDAHTATSMISSLMVGGMGSSRSRRLST